MKILFYGNAKSVSGKKILKMINEQVSQLKVECYDKIETFSDRLCRFIERPVIAVLILPDKNEIVRFLEIKDLLHDIHIILILLNSDKNAVTMAHQLYPRFTSCNDNSFKDVAAVLGKMMRSHKKCLTHT